MVHRVDAWDSYEAGALYYHTDTRAVIPPDEHRPLPFDKQAWDHNHGVRVIVRLKTGNPDILRKIIEPAL